jgi:drug/metabolite transporter (DMT)-like permease
MSPTGGLLVNPIRIVALVLMVVGVLGVVYGGFSYTKDKTAIKLGPIEVSVKETERVNIPLWAGVGAIVVGGFLFALGGRK